MGDKNMPPEGAAGEALPKLSAADFHKYNRMAEHMDQFVRGISIFSLFISFFPLEMLA